MFRSWILSFKTFCLFYFQCSFYPWLLLLHVACVDNLISSIDKPLFKCTKRYYHGQREKVTMRLNPQKISSKISTRVFLSQHSLLESEVRSTRAVAREAAERASAFLSQVNEHAARTADAIERVEGGIRLLSDQGGVVSRQQVILCMQR